MSLRRCFATGITASYAGDAQSSAPMLAVDDRLGYRVFASITSYLKEL